MEKIEVVVSFDTTGSMYPCITQVRRVVKEMVSNLFKDIPDLRMGIIAHGDYCDGKNCINQLALTDDEDDIKQFVTNVKATSGGDSPECYEMVLHQSRSFKWTAGAKKVLVLIGDDVPHEKNANPEKLDWKNELKCLLEADVKVYAVQALARHHATSFYREVAKITKGIHLSLDQFSELHYLISAITYQQQGPTALDNYQKFVSKHESSRSLDRHFDVLRGKKVDYSESYDYGYDDVVPDTKGSKKLVRVPMGRFQVLDVEEDTPIAEFVSDNGLLFKVGRGFYQFQKPVKVQSYKEVILQDKVTGVFYTGDKARKLAGIPIGKDAKVSPTGLAKYNVFVQSTSANRKLLAGSKFLYEVDMTR
jgi:hypothetical protein